MPPRVTNAVPGVTGVNQPARQEHADELAQAKAGLGAQPARCPDRRRGCGRRSVELATTARSAGGREESP